MKNHESIEVMIDAVLTVMQAGLWADYAAYTKSNSINNVLKNTEFLILFDLINEFS
jgi:hypothetical protein